MSVDFLLLSPTHNKKSTGGHIEPRASTASITNGMVLYHWVSCHLQPPKLHRYKLLQELDSTEKTKIEEPPHIYPEKWIVFCDKYLRFIDFSSSYSSSPMKTPLSDWFTGKSTTNHDLSKKIGGFL